MNTWVIAGLVLAIIAIVAIILIILKISEHREKEFNDFVDECVEKEIVAGLSKRGVVDYKWWSDEIYENLQIYIKNQLIDKHKKNSLRPSYEIRNVDFLNFIYKKVSKAYMNDQNWLFHRVQDGTIHE